MTRLSAAKTVLVVAMATVVLVAGFSSSAHAQPCEAVVAAQLERLQVDQDAVRSIAYQARYRSSRNGAHLVAYEAWVDLAQCRGSLVIDMSRTCRMRQAYTTDECRVPGVAAY